jgi:hypothetical protein
MFDQLMIDIEDNDNCGYFPIQVFETQSEPRTSSLIRIPSIPESDEPHDVTGWSSDDGGSPCDAVAVLVGDSGSGQAMMIYGGDHGVRIRPSAGGEPWSLESSHQTGEPYILLQTSVQLELS